MRYLTVTFISVFAMAATGCAFMSKDVKLNPISAIQPGSQTLSGVDFSVSVRDSRKSAPGVVGSTGWSFGDVVTKDDISKWVQDAITSEIENAGGHKADGGAMKVLCSVNTLEASMGFLSLINSRLAIDVTVANGNAKKALGELSVEHSPFVFFDSNAAYEETISETLKIWLERHAPKIITVLGSLPKKPVKPTKTVEPTTEPEQPIRPVKPRLPDLTVTSPKSGTKSGSSSIIVAGQAENAAGGEIVILVNGERKGSIHLITSHEPFSMPVKLFAGENRLKLSLKPVRGKSVTRELKATFVPSKLSGRQVLTIGISKFNKLGESADADKTASDVNTVFKTGIKQESGKQTVNIASGVTVRKALSEMKRAFGAAKDDESVIIYYCGIVTTGTDRLALAVPETDPKNPATAVMLTDIVLAAERYFQGKRILIIAQGAAGKSLSGLPEPRLTGESLSLLVYAPSKGNAAAAYNGLSKKADKNRDGYVTVSELRSYLNTKGNASLYGAIETDFRITRIKMSEK